MKPTEHPSEATLHRLVEKAPHLLALSDSPTWVVVGSEVRLGTGYADLIGIEVGGRPVVVEVKLARNAEARRAVVAQILAYAAALYRCEVDTFEKDVLGSHLRERGFASLADAAKSVDQVGSFDLGTFQRTLAESLRSGHLRLVIVLDAAPSELVRIGGYLEQIAPGMVIDLITLDAYDVNGSKIVVPQRVDPLALQYQASIRPSGPQLEAALSETLDIEPFAASVAQSDHKYKPQLERLLAFARRLETEKLATLSSFRGLSKRWVLLPRLETENAGLVTLWNENGAAIQLWRSVFQRTAPMFIDKVERKLGKAVGQGNSTREFDDELLDILFAAYRHAANQPSNVQAST